MKSSYNFFLIIIIVMAFAIGLYGFYGNQAQTVSNEVRISIDDTGALILAIQDIIQSYEDDTVNISSNDFQKAPPDFIFPDVSVMGDLKDITLETDAENAVLCVDITCEPHYDMRVWVNIDEDYFVSAVSFLDNNSD